MVSDACFLLLEFMNLFDMMNIMVRRLVSKQSAFGIRINI